IIKITEQVLSSFLYASFRFIHRFVKQKYLKSIVLDKSPIWKMKNKVLAGLRILVFAALIGHYLFMRSDLIVGDPAPDFNYENRAGETTALSNFTGKYVIL